MLEEFTRSAMAQAHGVANIPSREHERNIEEMVRELLDPLREMWGSPLRVTSGYRCPELNMLVGGAADSMHMSGKAADITAGSRSANSSLMDMILGSGLEFDQLIEENDFSWLHISYSRGGNRRQVLSLKGNGR